jgi:hypothetical protein
VNPEPSQPDVPNAWCGDCRAACHLVDPPMWEMQLAPCPLRYGVESPQPTHRMVPLIGQDPWQHFLQYQTTWNRMKKLCEGVASMATGLESSPPFLSQHRTDAEPLRYHLARLRDATQACLDALDRRAPT